MNYYPPITLLNLIWGGDNLGDNPHKKISEILPLHSGNIVVLSNK